MSDIHAITSITGEVAAYWSATGPTCDQVIKTWRDRNERIGDGTGDPPDLVILAVPNGRGRGVADSLVSAGFAHGDVRAPEVESLVQANAIDANNDDLPELRCGCNPSPWTGYSEQIAGETCARCREEIRVVTTAPLDGPGNPD